MFKRFFERKKIELEDSSRSPTSKKVRSLVETCSICGETLAGHQFAQVATTIISDANKPRVKALYEHVKNHEWAALPGFKDFRGDLDDLIVHAIKGPHPGGMVVLFRDPADLYAKVEVYLMEALKPQELDAIEELVPNENWEEL